MTGNDDKPMPSFLEDMADEYRADTIGRLAKISVALDKLAGNDISPGSQNNDLVEEIESQIHTIKGSSKTFGFSGLSLVAHAMDDFLQSQPVTEMDPLVLRDLGHLNDLMISVAGAGDIIPEETAARLLAELHLDTDRRCIEQPTGKRATALLVMERGRERETTVRSLENLGLTVVLAHDSVLAIELATLQRPDVIVTTLLGGRLSAPELVQVFSEINATASVPVIVVLPDPDAPAQRGSKDALALVSDAFPATVHRLKQATGLGRELSAKLVELGVVRP